jgi:hypothetical protein
MTGRSSGFSSASSNPSNRGNRLVVLPVLEGSKRTLYLPSVWTQGGPFFEALGWASPAVTPFRGPGATGWDNRGLTMPQGTNVEIAHKLSETKGKSSKLRWEELTEILPFLSFHSFFRTSTVSVCPLPAIHDSTLGRSCASTGNGGRMSARQARVPATDSAPERESCGR